MNKILSIIIPTRNRQLYCLEAVVSILKELNDDCELVIQDNSTDDSLKEQIEKLNDRRIIYNYNSIHLAFVDNFEEALEISSGKYFCILGDDDSLTKDIMRIVKWMDIHDVESLASTRVVDYFWPNDTILKYRTGSLVVPQYNGEAKFIDVDKKFKELVKKGFLSYQNYNLPRTYHGIVKRSTMDEVRKISGRFFGGLTPDIYSTIALSCIIKKHCVIDFPFSIAGACPASASASAIVGGHSGKLSDAPHFINRGQYNWEVDIPQYYSVETIWAETAIKAIKDMNRDELLFFFNKYRLYVYAILVNRNYIFKLSIEETIKLYKSLEIKKAKHILSLVKSSIEIVFSLLIKKITLAKFRENEDVILENVSSLEEAKKFIYNNIESSLDLSSVKN